MQNVDGDIVDYFVDSGCLAADRLVKDLALPDGVVVALIVRDHEIIPPQGHTRIEMGDHVIVVLRPTVRTMVDRVFSHRGQEMDELPTALEFPLRGAIKVSDIEQFYNLKLDTNPDATLDELVRARLGEKRIVVGAAVPFDQIVLYVREIGASGWVLYVGMVILPAAASDSTGIQAVDEVVAPFSEENSKTSGEEHA